VVGRRWLGSKVSYEWTFKHQKSRIEISTSGEPAETQSGSEEEFITIIIGLRPPADGGTVEYQVQHPRWQIWKAREATFVCDIEGLYGKAFAPFLQSAPASAFLADGSAVTVFNGTRLALK